MFLMRAGPCGLTTAERKSHHPTETVDPLFAHQDAQAEQKWAFESLKRSLDQSLPRNWVVRVRSRKICGEYAVGHSQDLQERLLLGTVLFTVCFAAWGLIGAFAPPRFRQQFHISASRTPEFRKGSQPVGNQATGGPESVELSPRRDRTLGPSYESMLAPIDNGIETSYFVTIVDALDSRISDETVWRAR